MAAMQADAARTVNHTDGEPSATSLMATPGACSQRFPLKDQEIKGIEGIKNLAQRIRDPEKSAAAAR